MGSSCSALPSAGLGDHSTEARGLGFRFKGLGFRV